MLIWSLIVVCLLVFGGIGFGAGAIGGAFLLLGVIIAGALAAPLGKACIPLIGMMGVKNIVWAPMLAPLIPQILIILVFLGVGIALHFAYFKNQRFTKDELTILRLQRVVRRTGVLFGLLAGAIVFFSIGRFVYSNGYIAVQTNSEEATTAPGWFKALAGARKDMEDTSMDKVFASMDHTPAKYYAWCDIFGLISSNPALTNRIFNYPPLLGFGERPDIQETIADADYMNLIFSKGSLPALIDHTRTQGFITSSEITDVVGGLDIADFRTYLETGKTPKYADEKLLGRWELDKNSTLVTIKKRRPDMKTIELVALRELVGKLPETVLILSPDNKSIVKVAGAAVPKPPAEGEQAAEPAAAPAPPVQARGITTTDPYSRIKQMARRNTGQQLPANNVRRPAAVNAAAAPSVEHFVPQIKGEGSWKSGIGAYELTLQDAAGKPINLAGRVEEDELTLASGDIVLVFQRVF